MKLKRLLQTMGLMTLSILLSTALSNAQIHLQGLSADHEGFACWDADGTGPEPASTSHIIPFLGVNAGYYASSRDYDNIDPHPDAAFCHFLNNINGFPLFVQALANNGFTAEQVKIKLDLFTLQDDLEGLDWFTFNNSHYLNRYGGFFHIELNDELMISCKINYVQTYSSFTGAGWEAIVNYTLPVDASANSSEEVQEVAAAFIADLEGQEVIFIFEDCPSAGATFYANGRNGVYFDIVSAYIEKGFPELPFTGPGSEHQGFACWDADGTGPEPEAYGHTFYYNNTLWDMPYYIASRDYDGIDPDPNAALGHSIDGSKGFSNLELQLAYRGFTPDQLKIKSSYGTAGNDIEGIDWGLDDNIHWYHYYGYNPIIEINGEPILKFVIDTSFSFDDLDIVNDNWWSYTNDAVMVDISETASPEAQYVAASFMKDIGSHPVSLYTEGSYAPGTINGNGRSGIFHHVDIGKILPKLPDGTLIWGGAVSGVWTLVESPYIIMDYIYVPDGLTLEIKEGVVVKFNTMEDFDINGRLLAEGTDELPILFTAYDESVRWGGIDWDHTPVTNDTSKVKHCIFEYAYSYSDEPGYNSGAAVGVNMVEKLKISHCTFRYNLADKPGPINPAGGAMVVHESSIHVSHCIFHDNQAGHGGAVCISDNSSSVFDNCLFYNNEAIYYYGGAILVHESQNPFFINCTFADNFAKYHGGVAELQKSGTTSFVNCIFWGNSAGFSPRQFNMILSDDTCKLNIYYSDVEEGLDGIDPEIQLIYEENLKVDPMFMGININYPYYYLQGSSPCMNVGTTDPQYFPSAWVCPCTCLCGNPRVSGGGIDMGSYELLAVRMNEITNSENLFIQVFPNPANGISEIRYQISEFRSVSLKVYDITGKQAMVLVNQVQTAGEYKVKLDVADLPDGLYMIRLQAGNESAVGKLLVVH